MKKIAIILALMLVFGAVFISGCTTTPSNSSNNTGNMTGQKNGSGIPGYTIVPSVITESCSLLFETES